MARLAEHRPGGWIAGSVTVAVLVVAAVACSGGSHGIAGPSDYSRPVFSRAAPPLERLYALPMSGPDGQGLRTLRAIPNHLPWVAQWSPDGGESTLVWHRYSVRLPGGTKVLKVSSFVATDRGDVAEIDVDVYSAKGFTLFQSAIRDQAGETYDAWRDADTDYTSVDGDPLILSWVLRCTGMNVLTQDRLARAVLELRLAVLFPPGTVH
jgi:hypothetical protein